MRKFLASFILLFTASSIISMESMEKEKSELLKLAEKLNKMSNTLPLLNQVAMISHIAAIKEKALHELEHELEVEKKMKYIHLLTIYQRIDNEV